MDVKNDRFYNFFLFLLIAWFHSLANVQIDYLFEDLATIVL